MPEGRSGGGAPTVLRVVLGKRLQALREAAGLSYAQAGRALDVTHATVRRMEKAEVGLKIPYVEKLLTTYGVTDPAQIDSFLTLVREANRPGWWHRYRDVIPEWFSAFVSLEGAASIIRAYEPHYVPGLLQTEDYARAVLRSGRPHASEEEIERRVAFRMERQRLLARDRPPVLWPVVDETVFRRLVGGRRVMREQVTRLIETADMPQVQVQLLPYAAGPHPAMYGPFHLFRFPMPELPDMVYSENLIGAVYYDQRGDVSLFLEALDRMCAMAASTTRTIDLLRELRDEL